MILKRLFVVGALTLLLAASLISFQLHAHEAHTHAWEAVNETVSVGKKVKVAVRLTGLKPPPEPDKITVTSVELDMGPDGMAMMKAPLKRLPSSEAGIIAFETDLVMAGRWEMTIFASVEGEPEPYSGSVIFTAVDEEKSHESHGQDGKERKVLYYRNPMGLPDVSPTPKKDSMGMDYIPVYEDEAAGPEGTVRISPEKIQRAGVRTEPVERRVLARAIRGSGTVAADEARIGDVTARFSGYVEKLFVAETGVKVRKGQPLMRVRIEDPDLIARQNDLTKTLMSITQKLIVTENAQRDLQYIYGFSSKDIEEIRRGRRPVRFLTLTAPESGTVTEKPAVAGARFGSGDLLMRTTDYSKVWVIARIAERDFGEVRVGQIVQVTPRAYTDAPMTGKVTLLYPELDSATRTGLARIELANADGLLKAGMYADISIEAKEAAKPVVAVPGSAVIDSGTRQVAFVAMEEGVFEPRPVKLGRRGSGYVEVLEGLNEGENIVVRGNFLIDAESNLQSALAAFRADAAQVDATTGQP